MSEPLLVRACKREQVERTPVWFMRQAGRSLPEYRELREKHSFFEIAETPELCAEVTLQPVRRHDVDAAVLFADIVTPVIAMGAPVELVEGVGPVTGPSDPDGGRDREAPRALSGSCFRAGPRGDPTRARGAAWGEGARRILRRSVHRRVLPRRGPREPRVPPRPRADVARARTSGTRSSGGSRTRSRATSRRRWRRERT